jgi:hypothetical protein
MKTVRQRMLIPECFTCDSALNSKSGGIFVFRKEVRSKALKFASFIDD